MCPRFVLPGERADEIYGATVACYRGFEVTSRTGELVCEGNLQQGIRWVQSDSLPKMFKRLIARAEHIQLRGEIAAQLGIRRVRRDRLSRLPRLLVPESLYRGVQ